MNNTPPDGSTQILAYVWKVTASSCLPGCYNEKTDPAQHSLVCWVSASQPYVASLFPVPSPDLWSEPVLIRVKTHGPLWGFQSHKHLILLRTEVLTFHFALSLRQCIPSYSDSCGFAIDWLDVQVLRSCSRSYKRKVKGPSFKNALGHTLKVDDDSLYVQLCGRVSGLTFIVTRGNSTFCSYVT